VAALRKSCHATREGKLGGSQPLAAGEARDAVVVVVIEEVVAALPTTVSLCKLGAIVDSGVDRRVVQQSTQHKDSDRGVERESVAFSSLRCEKNPELSV
jgi:hypothetical protein